MEEPEVTDQSTDKANAFRLNAQRVMLTYKTKINKDTFKKWAKGDLGACDVHVAHETGGDGTYEHTHALIEWSKPFQTRCARRFDLAGIHPNIKKIQSREHLLNAYKYLAKEDTTCAYLLEKQSTAFCKRVWSAKSLSQALEEVEKPSDVLGTVAMFKYKPQEEIRKETLDNPRPWQRLVINIIDSEPDDRSIYWICDPAGGAGKSRLCRYLEDNGKAIVLTGLGNAKDVAQTLRGRIERGESTRCIIGDLSRSYADRDIYNVLEMIKNGRMDSPKYESISLRWNAGHVLVFANFPPEPGRMTPDRLKLISIE